LLPVRRSEATSLRLGLPTAMINLGRQVVVPVNGVVGITFALVHLEECLGRAV
jgi:hypothetical protein